MGIWDLIKKKLANDGEQHHDQFPDTTAKNVYDIAAFDMNNATLTDKMMYLLDNRSQGEQIQFADKLLREGPFEVSIKMYEALIQKYPEERDRYENGIGSAFLKLGQHEKAIDYFKTARSHGMHPEISDRHIWDACYKHYKATGSVELVSKYESFSDVGKYRQAATEILTQAGYAMPEPAPAPTPAPVAEIITSPHDFNPTESPQTEDDVAKKNKNIVPENQFSLFDSSAPKEEDAPKTETSPEEPVAEAAPEPEATPEPEPQESEAEKAEADDDNLFVVRPDMLQALDQHIDQFFEFEDVVVWRDKRTDNLKIDIYHIKPNDERPYHILMTYGMSRSPMKVPDNAKGFEFGELVAILPDDWDLSPEGLKKAENYWPVFWLKNLARIPQQYDSWLCYGHSIPNGDPSSAIADTSFEGVVIMDSVTLPEDFLEVKVDDYTLYLYTVIPVYPEEMEYKISHGVEALREKLADAGIGDWIIPFRPSAVAED